MRHVFYLFLIIAWTSCISLNPPTVDSGAESSGPLETTTDTLYRISVSFYSKGAGPDINAKEDFMQYIFRFEQKHNVRLNYETVSWGREGETDYCLRLAGLNKIQEKSFIEDTYSLLKQSSLVHIEENVSCRQQR